MKMRNFIRIFIIAIFSFVFMISCEKDNETDTGDIREEYVGQWNVTEVNSILGTSNYTAEIIKADIDETILVKNFHNLGNTVSVQFDLSDNKISIPNQVKNDNTISGSGTSTINYDKIELTYTVIAGGDTENVTATYTKKQ